MTSTDNLRDPSRHRDSRSTPGLLTDLVNQLTSLFGKEVELVRTELSEKVTQALAGVGFIVAAAVFLIGAVNIVFAALVEAGLHPQCASLIVAAGATLIGLLFALKGMSSLKANNLSLQHTTEQVRRDAALIKETLQ